MPPGWSDWHVSDFSGYAEFNYVQDDNGRVDRYGGPTGGCGGPDDAATTACDALASTRRSVHPARRGAPVPVEVATFAPHRRTRRRPATPATSRA